MDLRGGAYVSRTVARTFTLPCVAVACDASAPTAANGEPRREGRRTAGAALRHARRPRIALTPNSATLDAASSCWAYKAGAGGAQKLLLSSDSLPVAPPPAKCLHLYILVRRARICRCPLSPVLTHHPACERQSTPHVVDPGSAYRSQVCKKSCEMCAGFKPAEPWVAALGPCTAAPKRRCADGNVVFFQHAPT